MLTRTCIWGNARNHDCPRVAHKGVPKHLRQFAPSEWDMNLIVVKCPNALLQGKETLVDFSSLNSVQKRDLRL